MERRARWDESALFTRVLEALEIVLEAKPDLPVALAAMEEDVVQGLQALVPALRHLVERE